MSNEKAKRILFKTYWSSQGWRKSPTVLREERAFAIAKGYMFDPIRMSHDEICQWLEHALSTIKLEDVTNAFLASLSTRRLEWRSVLGSFAIARNFPNHGFHAARSWFICSTCGFIGKNGKEIDLSVMNFERHKWGGVRHESPEYAAFDLEQFSRITKPTPSSDDIALFHKIITVARESEPMSRARDLEKRLAVIVDSNIHEREVLIQILGYCGILQPDSLPSYFQGFVNYEDRTSPPVNKIDWTYPICWWRGKDGVNQKALEYYFHIL
jgi:hypothetical protein